MPDYSSFARFRNGKAKEAVEELFYQFVKRLAELEETEYEEVFIDGTKIERMANRYTFVWKAGVAAFSNRTDSGTLIPFLNHIQQMQSRSYRNIVADVSYESIRNYLYLE